MLTVLAPGPRATVQDAGRPGFAHLGVARSGAFDLPALQAANRLVGNDPDAAGVEVTLGGLRLRADRAVTVALTGAACPGVDHGVALSLPAGAQLDLGVPMTGVRTYLAVRGGLAVPRQLGSAATDTLGGLGPAPLAAGDQLIASDRVVGEISGAVVPSRPVVAALPMRWGPRDDWFSAAALAELVTGAWHVRGESDRVGVRLDGPRLTRTRNGELPSEPVRPGAIQVPHDGRPLIFGPDAPLTGGYPVIGVVRDLAAAAQLRPGDTVRFVHAG